MPPSDSGPGLSETRAASFSPPLRERTKVQSYSPVTSKTSSVPSTTPKSCPSCCVVVDTRAASTTSPKYAAVYDKPTANKASVVLSLNRLYGAPASPQNSSSVTSSSGGNRSRGSSSSNGTKTFSDGSGNGVLPSNCERAMSCCAVEPTTSTANSANSRRSCLSAFRRVTGSSMQSAANSPSTSPLLSSDSAVMPMPMSPVRGEGDVSSDLPPLSPPPPPSRDRPVPPSPSHAILPSTPPPQPPPLLDDPALLPTPSDIVVPSASPSPVSEAAAPSPRPASNCDLLTSDGTVVMDTVHVLLYGAEVSGFEQSLSSQAESHGDAEVSEPGGDISLPPMLSPRTSQPSQLSLHEIGFSESPELTPLVTEVSEHSSPPQPNAMVSSIMTCAATLLPALTLVGTVNAPESPLSDSDLGGHSLPLTVSDFAEAVDPSPSHSANNEASEPDEPSTTPQGPGGSGVTHGSMESNGQGVHQDHLTTAALMVKAFTITDLVELGGQLAFVREDSWDPSDPGAPHADEPTSPGAEVAAVGVVDVAEVLAEEVVAAEVVEAEAAWIATLWAEVVTPHAVQPLSPELAAAPPLECPAVDCPSDAVTVRMPPSIFGTGFVDLFGPSGPDIRPEQPQVLDLESKLRFESELSAWLTDIEGTPAGNGFECHTFHITGAEPHDMELRQLAAAVISPMSATSAATAPSPVTALLAAAVISPMSATSAATAPSPVTALLAAAVTSPMSATSAGKAPSPVTAPLAAAVTSPMSATSAGKAPSPVMAPLAAAVMSPMSATSAATAPSPVMAPLAAAATSPMPATSADTAQSPVTAPLAAAATSPMSATSADTAQSPVTAPLAAAVTSPMSATSAATAPSPVTAPLAAAATSPMSATSAATAPSPLTAPLAVTALSPASAPSTVPVPSPVMASLLTAAKAGFRTKSSDEEAAMHDVVPAFEEAAASAPTIDATIAAAVLSQPAACSGQSSTRARPALHTPTAGVSNARKPRNSYSKTIATATATTTTASVSTAAKTKATAAKPGPKPRPAATMSSSLSYLRPTTTATAKTRTATTAPPAAATVRAVPQMAVAAAPPFSARTRSTSESSVTYTSYPAVSSARRKEARAAAMPAFPHSVRQPTAGKTTAQLSSASKGASRKCAKPPASAAAVLPAAGHVKKRTMPKRTSSLLATTQSMQGAVMGRSCQGGSCSIGGDGGDSVALAEAHPLIEQLPAAANPPPPPPLALVTAELPEADPSMPVSPAAAPCPAEDEELPPSSYGVEVSMNDFQPLTALAAAGPTPVTARPPLTSDVSLRQTRIDAERLTAIVPPHIAHPSVMTASPSAAAAMAPQSRGSLPSPDAFDACPEKDSAAAAVTTPASDMSLAALARQAAPRTGPTSARTSPSLPNLPSALKCLRPNSSLVSSSPVGLAATAGVTVRNALVCRALASSGVSRPMGQLSPSYSITSSTAAAVATEERKEPAVAITAAAAAAAVASPTVSYASAPLVAIKMQTIPAATLATAAAVAMAPPPLPSGSPTPSPSLRSARKQRIRQLARMATTPGLSSTPPSAPVTIATPIAVDSTAAAPGTAAHPAAARVSAAMSPGIPGPPDKPAAAMATVSPAAEVATAAAGTAIPTALPSNIFAASTDPDDEPAAAIHDEIVKRDMDAANPVAAVAASQVVAACGSPAATPAAATPAAGPVTITSPAATPVATASPAVGPITMNPPAATPAATASPAAGPISITSPAATPAATASPAADPIVAAASHNTSGGMAGPATPSTANAKKAPRRAGALRRIPEAAAKHRADGSHNLPAAAPPSASKVPKASLKASASASSTRQPTQAVTSGALHAAAAPIAGSANLARKPARDASAPRIADKNEKIRAADVSGAVTTTVAAPAPLASIPNALPASMAAMPRAAAPPFDAVQPVVSLPAHVPDARELQRQSMERLSVDDMTRGFAAVPRAPQGMPTPVTKATAAVAAAAATPATAATPASAAAVRAKARLGPPDRAVHAAAQRVAAQLRSSTAALAAVLAAAKNAVRPPAVGLTQRCPATAVVPEHRNSPRRLQPCNPSLPGPVRGTKAAVTPALASQRACVRPANPTSRAVAATPPVATVAAARRPQEGKTLPASEASAGLRKATIKETATAAPPRPQAQTGTEPAAPAAAPAAVTASLHKQYNSTLHGPVKCAAARAAAGLHHVTLTVAAVMPSQGTAVQSAAPVSAIGAQPHGSPAPLVVRASTSQSGGGPAAETVHLAGGDPVVRVPTAVEATAKRQGVRSGADPAAAAMMTLLTSGPAGQQREATVAAAVADILPSIQENVGVATGTVAATALVPPSCAAAVRMSGAVHVPTAARATAMVEAAAARRPFRRTALPATADVASVPSAKPTQMQQHVPGVAAMKQPALATQPAAAKQTAAVKQTAAATRSAAVKQTAAAKPPPLAQPTLKLPDRDTAKPGSSPIAPKRAAARPGPAAAAAAGAAAKVVTRAAAAAATKENCVAGQPPNKRSLATKPNSAPVPAPTRRLPKSYAAMAQASAERMPDRVAAAAAAPPAAATIPPPPTAEVPSHMDSGQRPVLRPVTAMINQMPDKQAPKRYASTATLSTICSTTGSCAAPPCASTTARAVAGATTVRPGGPVRKPPLQSQPAPAAVAAAAPTAGIRPGKKPLPAAAAGRSVKAPNAAAMAALPPALQLPRTPWKVASKSAPKPLATKRRAPGIKAPVAAASAAANLKAPAAKPLKAPPPSAAGVRGPATIKQVSAAGPATVEVVLTASPMPIKCGVAASERAKPAAKAAAPAGRQLKADGGIKAVIPPPPSPQPQPQRKLSRTSLAHAAAPPVAVAAASAAPVTAVSTNGSAHKANKVTGPPPPSEAAPTTVAPPENNAVRNEPVRDSVRRSKAEVTAAAAIAAAAAAAAAAAMMTRRSTTVRPKLYAELLEVARRGQAAKPAPMPAAPKAAVVNTAARQGFGPRSASKAGFGSGCGFEAPPGPEPDLVSRRAINPANVTATAGTPRPASIRTALQAASPGAPGDPLVTARWDGTAVAVAPPPPAVALASAAAVTTLQPPRSPSAAVRSALPASGSRFTTAVGSRGPSTRQGFGPGLVSESPRAEIQDPRQGPLAALPTLPAHQAQMAPADANPANAKALKPASLMPGHRGTAAVAPRRMPTATQVAAATAVQAARQRTAAAAMPPPSPPQLYDCTRSYDTARDRTIITAATGTASGSGGGVTARNATVVAAARRAGADKRASRRPMGLGATPISVAAVAVSPSPAGRVDLSPEVAALRTAVSKPVHGSGAPSNAPVAMGRGRPLGPAAVEDKASARSSCGETSGVSYGAAGWASARVLARGYGVRGTRWK